MCTRPEVPAGVCVGEEYLSLLSLFQQGGIRKLQMVADFDQTLTTFVGSDNLGGLQCHEIILKHMDWTGLGLQEQVAPLLEWHDMPEDERMRRCGDCKIERRERSRWFCEGFQDLTRTAQLGERRYVDECVGKANTRSRPGLQALFNCLDKWGIPLAIISAGLLQIIRALLNRDGVHLPNCAAIIANDMGSERVSVTSRSKADIASTLARHHFESADEQGRHHVILLGDKPTDCDVVQRGFEQCKVMRIGFMKGSLSAPGRDEEKRDFLKFFDVVLTDDAPLDFVSQLLVSIADGAKVSESTEPTRKRLKIEG